MINLLKKLPFYRRYTTNQNLKYWAKRDYGWDEYAKTWTHPHRTYLSSVLSQMRWFSLLEIGCGSGPNLINIAHNIQGRQLGGIDINPKAIEELGKHLKGAYAKVSSAQDIFMSDKSVDLALTDMFLIYVGPLKIRKQIEEIKRVTRKYVVFCEYHEKSWWRRWYLRVFSGRHSYNYKKLLQKSGFYDILIQRMPIFEEDGDQRYRHLIIACVPNK